MLLESAARAGSAGRYSIYAFDPVRLLSVEFDSGQDPFELLAEACRPWSDLSLPPDVPFVGGWIGCLAYEAGHFVEPSASFHALRSSSVAAISGAGAFGAAISGAAISGAAIPGAAISDATTPDATTPGTAIRDRANSGVATFDAGTSGADNSGTAISGVASIEQPMPIASWALFDTVLVHDAVTDSWIVAGAELPWSLRNGPRPTLEARLDALEAFAHRAGDGALPESTDLRDLDEAAARRPGRSAGRGNASDLDASPQLAWDDSRESYLAKVERALEYIRAGDIFQVNLARRCRAAVHGHPFELYERLCKTNPAAYAAYLPISPPADSTSTRNASAVLSSSPELFLAVRGGEVVTRPIKGTRPRGRTPEEDAAAAQALACSEKDRAELNMIIDLERNDLGRVCEYGSVRVRHDGEIEAHPTVWHRTAAIAGRLRRGADCLDVLKAAFPGGSITGAPKVRAMQIIHELEPAPRGPYCGAIGWIGLDGSMTLNLAIRTMLVTDGIADVKVGSAIVADSDPADEYRELEAKAAGMLAALGCRCA